MTPLMQGLDRQLAHKSKNLGVRDGLGSIAFTNDVMFSVSLWVMCDI